MRQHIPIRSIFVHRHFDALQRIQLCFQIFDIIRKTIRFERFKATRKRDQKSSNKNKKKTAHSKLLKPKKEKPAISGLF
jgi:hypothetical protein